MVNDKLQFAVLNKRKTFTHEMKHEMMLRQFAK